MGTGRYTRTGFFVRPSVGVGYLRVFRSPQAQAPGGANAFTGNSSVSTFPTEFELALGLSFTRDFAGGLFITAANAPTAKLSTDAGELDLEGGLSLGIVGLGVLLYPSPTSGWMLGAVLGATSWRARVADEALDEIGGNGVSLSLRLGHEWWLGPYFSISAEAHGDAGAATGNTETQFNQTNLQAAERDYLLRASAMCAISWF